VHFPSISNKKDNRMKSTTGRKRIFVSSTIALLIMGGGIAYAYFSTTGSGVGDSSVGTSTPLVITQIADGSTTGDASFSDVALLPGGPVQGLAVSISNPSQGDQGIHSVTVTTATASLGAVATYNLAHASPALQATTSDATTLGIPIPGCLASWFGMMNWSPVGGDLVVGGNASVTIGNVANGSPDATSTLSVSLTSAGVIQDSCKNKDIDLKFASN
jgi:hypothetical protein